MTRPEHQHRAWTPLAAQMQVCCVLYCPSWINGRTKQREKHKVMKYESKLGPSQEEPLLERRSLMLESLPSGFKHYIQCESVSYLYFIYCQLLYLSHYFTAVYTQTKRKVNSSAQEAGDRSTCEACAHSIGNIFT